MTEPATERLMTPEELAAYLQIPTRTLGQWRYQGHGPRWSLVGRHARYRPSDVEAWLDAQASDAPSAPLADGAEV